MTTIDPGTGLPLTPEEEANLQNVQNVDDTVVVDDTIPSEAVAQAADDAAKEQVASEDSNLAEPVID